MRRGEDTQATRTLDLRWPTLEPQMIDGRCSMHVLYFLTRGANDPTGASLPLHIAVNGSLQVGHDVSVVLAGDGADLARSGTREEVHGVAIPQLRDLFAALIEHRVPVYV
jgi:predicted peroxiredoxin